jgi:hypothetical protein
MIHNIPLTVRLTCRARAPMSGDTIVAHVNIEVI